VGLALAAIVTFAGGLLMVQLGIKHADIVHAVAFAPDGSAVASAGDDGRVLVWDPTTGLARTLPGQAVSVFSVAFAPDGKTLAANCWDGKKGFVELRSYPSGEVKATFGDRKQHGWAIRYSPDGSRLAVDGSNVELWDAQGEKKLYVLRARAQALAFSREGKTLATGNNGEIIHLWDVVSGQELRALDGKPGGVYSVAFSPDGKLLATVSNEIFATKENAFGLAPGFVKIWDLATGTAQSEFRGTYQIRSLAFSPDGRTLAVGQRDGNVLYWDTTARRMMETVRATRPGINALAYSPDGRILAAGCQDGTVKMLQPPRPQQSNP